MALAPFLSACGGGSDNASEPLPPTPKLTVPGEAKTPTVPDTASTDTSTDTSTSTSTSTSPTQTTATPTEPSGGTAAPNTGGATPDSPQNDEAPPAGSPAERFEQFCKDNPGAC
jgi:hypothetical protein